MNRGQTTFLRFEKRVPYSLFVLQRDRANIWAHIAADNPQAAPGWTNCAATRWPPLAAARIRFDGPPSLGHTPVYFI